MKRWAYFALILLLTGCAKPPAAPTPDPAPPVTQAPEAPAPTGPTPELLPDHATLAHRAGLFFLDTQTRQIWQADNQNLTIWSPDGRSLLQITEHGLDRLDLPGFTGVNLIAGDINGAEWSPDGSRIAFSVLSGGATPSGTYIINRDGSLLRRVTPSGNDGRMTWSPDGQYLAFNEYPNMAQVRILQVEPATTVREIGTFFDLTPHSFTPDSRQLLLTGREDDVRLFDIATNTLRRLPIAHPSTKAWRPDGSLLIMEQGAAYERPFYQYDLKGQPVRIGEIDAFYAELSPDRRSVAFIGDGCTTNDWDLYVMALDGSAPRRLTSSPDELKLRALWTPAGDAVAYATHGKVGLVHVRSGETRLLIDDPNLQAVPGLAGWSADGRYLIFTYGSGKGICY